jgi:hypothetical protein
MTRLDRRRKQVCFMGTPFDRENSSFLLRGFFV